MVNKVDGNNYYTYTKQRKIDVPDTGEKFNLNYQKGESSPDAKDQKEISEQEKQQAAEKSGVRLELSTNARDAGAGRQKQTQAETAKAQSAAGQAPLLETIKTYVMAAIAAVRDFFHSIWNDQPQENASNIELSEGDPQDIQSLEDVPGDVRLMEGSLSEDASEIQVVEGDPQDVRPVRSALSETLRGTEEIIDASDERSVQALEEERRSREIRNSLKNGDMDHVIRLLTDNGRKTIAKNSTLLTSYDKNGRVVEPDASVRERALHGDKNTWEL